MNENVPFSNVAITTDVKSRFEAFRSDPSERLRIKLRHVRAKQIQRLFASPELLTLDSFNRDVWIFEGQSFLKGQSIKGLYWNLPKLTHEQQRLIEAALDADDVAALELHGNYVWSSATSVYGPMLKDLSQRAQNVQNAAEFLNEDTLTPEDKADLLKQIPGFGHNIATGLVMLFHPHDYAIYNSQAEEAIRSLGYDVRTLPKFQEAVHDLKARLGAADFLELDWFLYQENNREKDEPATTIAPSEIMSNPDPRALPRAWWVNQGTTYTQEREGGYLWAPKQGQGGQTVPHHRNMASVELGDLILHYSQGALRAVSQVNTVPQDAPNPFDNHQETWQREGYLVKSTYQDLVPPVRLTSIPVEWRIAGPGPFDKNGDVKQGYLYPLSPDFIDCLMTQLGENFPSALRTVISASTPVPASQPGLSQLGIAPPSTNTDGPLPRMVKVAPGFNANFWQECLQGSYICVGWDDLGDLKNYPTEADFKEAFEKAYPYKNKKGKPSRSKMSAKANELWKFRTLKPGDLVAANDGASKILGVGTVLSPGYQYRPDRSTFHHTVRVRWDTSFACAVPKQGDWPLKTVSEISPDLIKFILSGIPLSIPQNPNPTTVQPDPASPVPALTTPSPAPSPTPPLPDTTPDYEEPDFNQIVSNIAGKGLRLDDGLLRRYHLALKTRGFVILSGISGTGKTWLAEAYAQSVGAQHALVPVAPNWTTNEDLLGYLNPLSHTYHDTDFSRFLRRASQEYNRAQKTGQAPYPFHVILDEMNLARVEYYFAKFLSLMEIRARHGQASLALGEDKLILPPNLFFIGTVNIDETTHGFADKVYDRAQVLELTASRQALFDHIGDVLHRDTLLEVWDVVAPVAPFAFRVVDEIKAYTDHAAALGIPWQEALDEQLLQKVLPKLKGTDLQLGLALQHLAALPTADFPRTAAKAAAMQQGFSHHGFASFF